MEIESKFNNLDFTKITEEAFEVMRLKSFPYFVVCYGDKICLFENRLDSSPIMVFFGYDEFNKFLFSPEDWI